MQVGLGVHIGAMHIQAKWTSSRLL